eukprot:scaffold1328_cov394-Prasinococcus_capsulatus_cf.AAC.27
MVGSRQNLAVTAGAPRKKRFQKGHQPGGAKRKGPQDPLTLEGPGIKGSNKGFKGLLWYETVPRLFDVTSVEVEEQQRQQFEEDQERRRQFGRHAQVSGVTPPPPPAKIVLDGANLAWGYGQELQKHYGGPAVPNSRGILLALDYEPWTSREFSVTGFVPFNYVQGPLKGLCDGFVLNGRVPKHLTYMGKGLWRNEILWQAHQEGQLHLVKRRPIEQNLGARRKDDEDMIAYAREQAAFLCTNDKLRDHVHNRSLGFAQKAKWSAFTDLQRFGFHFDITSHRSKEQLLAAFDDAEWQYAWGKDHKEEKRSVWYKKRAPKVKGVLSTEYRSADEQDTTGELADMPMGGQSMEPAFECQYSTGSKAFICLPETQFPASFSPVPNDRMLNCIERYQQERMGRKAAEECTDKAETV